MRRAWISTAALFLAGSALASEPSSAAPPRDGSERVERARAALLQRLSDAKEDGVVEIRGDGPQTPSRTPAVAACLTTEMLIGADTATAGAPMETIESLRRLLLDGDGDERAEIDLQLAIAYLVVGFAEEARAIARAHDDPRAVAIAAIADVMSGEMIAGAAGCGDLYELAVKADRARAGGAPHLSETEIAMIAALPDPISAPIAEVFALAARDHQDQMLANRLRPLLDRDSKAAAFFEEPANASAALKQIASDPGPMQARAIEALATAADPAAASVVDENLEDAAARAAPHDRRRLGDLLVARGADQERIAASIRALRRAAARDPASPATRQAGAILRAAVAGKDSDKRLQALAAIASEHKFAAPALDDDAARRAIDELIAFGAVDALTRVLDARGAAGDDRDLALGGALARAGDIDKAWLIAAPHEGEAPFSPLLFRLAAMRGDAASVATAARAAASAGDQVSEARLAWRAGDWKRAQAAFEGALAKSPDDAVAEKLALAALASARSQAPPTISRTKNPAINALHHMFAPRPEQPTDRALRRFGKGVAIEADFIKKRLAHE